MRGGSRALLLQLLLAAAAGMLMAAAASNDESATSSSSSFGLLLHEQQDDGGLVCDSSEAQRGRILEQALAVLKDEFTLQRGNLSFHNGGNPMGKYGVVQLSEELLPPGLKKASKGK